MANDNTPKGFLSRWSRRKTDVREGRRSDEPVPALPPALRNASASANLASETAAVAVGEPTKPAHVSGIASTEPVNPSVAPPAPTLADTQQLTSASDFTGFMARGVPADVKNAAVKKLFSDPHFNVMDRLDIYIDDYSQPDPLPLAMLRQMVSAKALNLVDDEPAPSTLKHTGDMPPEAPAKVVAQSVTQPSPSLNPPSTHDHADLRLQPDPASGPQGTGPKPV